MKITLPKPPIPENAPGYANTAVTGVKNVDKLDLDYSVKSLEIVDGILNRFHKEGVSVEKIGGTLFAFGCYVGEVFIRNFGGQWKKEEETGMKGFGGFFIVVQLPNGMTVNPVGKVFTIVMEGVPGLPYFYQVFTQRRKKILDIFQDSSERRMQCGRWVLPIRAHKPAQSSSDIVRQPDHLFSFRRLQIIATIEFPKLQPGLKVFRAEAQKNMFARHIARIERRPAC